jgi:hypothetical protein
MTQDPVAQLLADPRFKGTPITWGITPEGYDAIRRAWLTHVQAEEVLFKPFTEEIFQAQIKIMLGVFTEDCVWRSHRRGSAGTAALKRSNFTACSWARSSTWNGFRRHSC